jgi:hypothetical protein
MRDDKNREKYCVKIIDKEAIEEARSLAFLYIEQQCSIPNV